jgi:enoyl-CoA hydratase/carnithine racemase
VPRPADGGPAAQAVAVIGLTADPRLLAAIGERLPVEALLDDAQSVLTIDGPPDAWDELAALPRAEAEVTANLMRRVPCVLVARHENPPLRAGFDLVDPDGTIAEKAMAAPEVSLTLALLVREPRVDTTTGLAAESAAYSMLQASPRFDAWLEAQGPLFEPMDTLHRRVLVERRGSVAFVSLTRARRHNALDPAMRDALVDALEPLRYEPNTTVVLRGEGASFCSGGDVATFGTAPPPADAHVVRLTRSPARACAGVADRLIAAIHGNCIGAGIELAAFAHHIVCADDASIRLPETELGLIPGAGGTVSIPRRIGRQRFLELAVTGRTLDAAEALELGLVDEVVAADSLESRVEAIVGTKRT